jgi:small-conductance mechanosensitive channel
MFQQIDNYTVWMRLLLALFTVILFWGIGYALRSFFLLKLKKRFKDPLLANFITTLSRIIIVLIGLLVSLRILGLSDIAKSLMAGAGISAFIIGFALKDIGENFLSGLLLASSRPFRVGDLIECNNIKGVVVALNLKDTELKTSDGKDVFVPNSMLIKNPLINYTLDGSHRYEFNLKINSTCDVNKAKLILEEVLLNTKTLIDEKHKPTVQLTDVTNEAFTFTIYYWMETNVGNSSSQLKTYTLLNMIKALSNEGILLSNK